MLSREELLSKLEDLCEGVVNREEIAQWAISIINSTHIRHTDEVVWSILEGLGAADFPTRDRDYLYTIEDFKAWQRELLDDIALTLDLS